MRFAALRIVAGLLYIAAFLALLAGILGGLGTVAVIDGFNRQASVFSFLGGFAATVPFFLSALGLFASAQFIYLFLAIEDHLYHLRYGDRTSRISAGKHPLSQ